MKGHGGISLEFGVNMYILLYIKCGFLRHSNSKESACNAGAWV